VEPVIDLVDAAAQIIEARRTRGHGGYRQNQTAGEPIEIVRPGAESKENIDIFRP
jgi:hypothetical protein